MRPLSVIFTSARIPRRRVVAVVVIEERNVGVIALDQAAARRVILRGGQRQAGVFHQRINGLHQAFAECVVAQNPGAVVILQGAGNDLGGAGGIAVHHHHDRIIAAVIAVARRIDMLGRSAAFVRNDHVALGQQMIGHRNGFGQQTAGIAAQIEHQALQIVLIQLLQRVFEFAAGGFVELLNAARSRYPASAGTPRARSCG